jgi:hypothetical protein
MDAYEPSHIYSKTHTSQRHMQYKLIYNSHSSTHKPTYPLPHIPTLMHTFVCTRHKNICTHQQKHIGTSAHTVNTFLQSLDCVLLYYSSYMADRRQRTWLRDRRTEYRELGLSVTGQTFQLYYVQLHYLDYLLVLNTLVLISRCGFDTKWVQFIPAVPARYY